MSSTRRTQELGILGDDAGEHSVTGTDADGEFPSLERTDTARTNDTTDDETDDETGRGLVAPGKRSSLMASSSADFNRTRTSSTPATANGSKDDDDVTDDIDAGVTGREDWVPQSLLDDDDEGPDPIGAIADVCKELNKCGRFKYYAEHSVREANKRRCNFCLGCCSCFLVVVIAATCYTMMDKAPAIFLNEGEADGGQVDLKMFPSESANSPFLNYSQVAKNAEAHPSLAYHTPRLEWQQGVNLYGSPCTETIKALNLSFTDKAWRYGLDPALSCSASPVGFNGSDCLPVLCADAPRINTGWLQLIDSAREQRMALGRHWPYSAIPSGSIMLDVALAQKANISLGDVVWMEVNLEEYSNPLLSTMTLNAAVPLGLNASQMGDAFDKMRMYGSVVVPVTVWQIIDDDFGKFNVDQRGKLIVMELESFWPFILAQISPRIEALTAQQISTGTSYNMLQLLHSQPLSEYSNMVYMNLPPPRTDAYLHTDYYLIQEKLIFFASRALYFINFPDIKVELDVLSALFILRFFTLFLGLILSIILSILFILSTMLIYSLLTISIETRTFELGVHRMVGMKRMGIVEMLSAQALSYALPAWVVGLALARGLVQLILQGIENSVGVPIKKELTVNSVLAATFLGLFIPMIAAIIPIRHALDSNLFEALDTKHSKTQAVKITLSRAEDGRMPSVLIALGLALTIFGFLIYYLMPLSLLSFNLALFFNIFFGILLAMLFGLVLLSLNLEHPVEQLITSLTLWWEARPVRSMVLKNLIAHRVRNRKTTIMYALAIGFTIFITVMFSMELRSAELRTLQRYGSKLRWGCWSCEITPSEQEAMHALVQDNPAIKDYAYITRELSDVRDIESGYFITNLGHVAFKPVRVWGVSPNYFDVADRRFIKTTHKLSTSASLSEQLYTVLGSQSVVLPASFTLTHAIDSLGFKGSFLTIPSIPLNDNANNFTVDIRHQRPMAIVTKLPRFIVQRFETTAEQDVVVSLPTYVRMLNGTNDISSVPISEFIFSIHKGATTEDLDRFVKELLKFPHRVTDFRVLEKSLDKTRNSMTVIFGAATYIAMGLCLFSLMASMYTNIFEQSKEIAILRAMGMTQGQIVKIYVYESFVLVMSSSFLGIMIGCVIAWSMAMQRVLFTQLPVTVEFPSTILMFVTIGALISAVVASWAPARRLVRKSVAQVMRTVV